MIGRTAIDNRRFKLKGDLLEYTGKSAMYSIYEREDSYMLESVIYDEVTGRKRTRFQNVSTFAEIIGMIEAAEIEVLEKIEEEKTFKKRMSKKERRLAA